MAAHVHASVMPRVRKARAEFTRAEKTGVRGRVTIQARWGQPWNASVAAERLDVSTARFKDTNQKLRAQAKIKLNCYYFPPLGQRAVKENKKVSF